MSIKEMTDYLLNNTDHKVVNQLLNSGMGWNEAVKMAYETVTAQPAESKKEEI